MRADGLGLKGVLVITCVLLAAFAILFGVQRYVMGQSDEFRDAQKMRQIYAALFMYETAHDDLPPPNLLAVRRDLADDSLLVAENDPFAKGPERDKTRDFPLDPACPNVKAVSPVRISFSYLPMWVRYGGVKIRNWHTEELDVRAGLLASWWYGKIDDSNEDGRNCTGPVLRLNMDGSVFHLDHRSDPTALTAQDLFFRR